MKYGRAFLAGVIGALVMSGVMALARWAGLPVRLEMLLGTLTGGGPSNLNWALGFLMHLFLGGIWAWLYGIGFEYVAHRAGPSLGVAFGVVHALVAGLFLRLVPILHPLVPELMPVPGYFLWNLGLTGVGLFVGVHVLFGLIVGWSYGDVVQGSPGGAGEKAAHAH